MKHLLFEQKLKRLSLPKYRHLIKDMIFMLQKEVVQRICATANDKNYGRLSIMLSQFFEAEFLFTLPPSAFSPPPKVDSAVLIMKTRKIYI